MRSMFLSAVGGSLALMLTNGCSTAAERQRDAIAARIQAMRQETAACSAAVRAMPETATVMQRLPALAPEGRPALQQRLDRTKPTQDDIAAIERWHTADTRCDQVQIASVRRLSPELGDILSSAMEDQDRVLVALVSRQTTWADANEQISAIRASFRSSVMDWASRTRTALAQAHNREIAQRNAAAGVALGILAAGAAGFAEGYVMGRYPPSAVIYTFP